MRGGCRFSVVVGGGGRRLVWHLRWGVAGWFRCLNWCCYRSNIRVREACKAPRWEWASRLQEGCRSVIQCPAQMRESDRYKGCPDAPHHQVPTVPLLHVSTHALCYNLRRSPPISRPCNHTSILWAAHRPTPWRHNAPLWLTPACCASHWLWGRCAGVVCRRIGRRCRPGRWQHTSPATPRLQRRTPLVYQVTGVAWMRPCWLPRWLPHPVVPPTPPPPFGCWCGAALSDHRIIRC